MVVKLIELLKNTQGNFALATAIVIPSLCVAGGMALDLANTMSLKERMQAAADSASLSVATKMASGTLSIEDAKVQAGDLFNAQLSIYNDRYTQLDYDADIDVTEVVDGSVTTWQVIIDADASIQTTGLSSLIGMDVMNTSIASTATISNEEIQGAFSMAVLVDISGSMYWPPDQAEALQDILSVNWRNASRASADLYDAYYVYGLSETQIQFIAQNYEVDDCDDVADSTNDRIDFLDSIGEPTSTDSLTAYYYCYFPAHAAENVGADNLVEHWDDVFANLAASKLRMLKTATATMFNQIAEADPDEKYVRTGTASYNSRMRNTVDLDWGVTHSDEFIENLSASGGTASTGAMEWGFENLEVSDGTEISEHSRMNGQVPDRYILFMTDGSNNYSGDDVDTQRICDEAKSDGIEIFSVAFAAPAAGQELLNYCATSSNYYFEPETADELVDVFEYIGEKTTQTLTRLTN